MGAKVGSGNSGYAGTQSGAGTSGSHDDGYRTVNGFSTKLHDGAQGKHIPGHNNYKAQEGRSVFQGKLSYAQELINEYAGSGTWLKNNRERIDFGMVIGVWVSPDGSLRLPTTRGIIHYGNYGAHIVPARPAEGSKQ